MKNACLENAIVGGTIQPQVAVGHEFSYLREFVLNSHHIGLRCVWKGGSGAAVQTPFTIAPADTRGHPQESSGRLDFDGRHNR